MSKSLSLVGGRNSSTKQSQERENHVSMNRTHMTTTLSQNSEDSNEKRDELDADIDIELFKAKDFMQRK